jgi:tetratricopeptide (TPR) repeat protein
MRWELNRISIVNLLSSILITGLALHSLPNSADETVANEPTVYTISQEEQAYTRAIEAIESSGGAYAPELSEPLLSLALTLQSQGRHTQAIALFRRGIHLTRVNEGLYCAQQVPLLQGEIASHLAIQDYAMADERQDYLYRVQTRSIEAGDALTDALMQQAQWQYAAYQLGLGAHGYLRLLNMTEFYRQALRNATAGEEEGETSVKLLAPLQGMLETQYLIAGYVWQESDRPFGEDDRPSDALLQFNAYRAQSYRQGNNIIEAIARIQRNVAQTQVMLGDWRLWNGRTKSAWQAYQKAEAELAGEDDAQVQLQKVFGQPIALPDVAGLTPLPPAVDPKEAEIVLEFTVDAKGKVQDLERIDDNDDHNKQAKQLMNRLRKTTFRPRFADGQPQETEKMVKAFNVQ